MLKDTCSEDGCSLEATCRGWCNPHYQRQYRQATGRLRPRKPAIERFLSKINPNGPKMRHMETQCHVWMAGRSSNGYGRFSAKKDHNPYTWYTHRYTWTHFIGPIPEGLFVCHECDNPLCVRLEHLFLGTSADNSADMVKKHRQAAGERAARSVLRSQQVSEIRVRHERGESVSHLASEFGVSSQNVYEIVSGETWKHLEQC